MKCPHCSTELQMITWIPSYNSKELKEYFCDSCNTVFSQYDTEPLSEEI